MSDVYLLNKPFGVLTQFTDRDGRETLADYFNVKDVYAAGRLDRDSEGLLVLTSDGTLQHHIADPRHKLSKTYWVQVEGQIDPGALARLERGVMLKDGKTRPAKVTVTEHPQIWDRTPPIRYRASIPTSWIELIISEGKNRQVRRMTAAVGYPTLRLIRYAIGPLTIDGLAPGEWRMLEQTDLRKLKASIIERGIIS
ncbi:MAG: pseudouridine synthase [Gammaproteobacteria bacterium]|nr:MAG: pseudouridine synthase [Gammaproteobacteria bacterium]